MKVLAQRDSAHHSRQLYGKLRGPSCMIPSVSLTADPVYINYRLHFLFSASTRLRPFGRIMSRFSPG
jgi:hypothetical protein